MPRKLGVVGLLLLWATGIAYATHPGAFNDYALLGFSADGKFVYFERESSVIMQNEKWLAVYDASKAKLATSQPVLRDCGDMDCMQGKPIKKAVGDKTIATLHKKYGAPVAANILAPKLPPALDQAIADAKKAGYVQTFEGTDVSVTTTSKLRGKLPDPNQDYGKDAGYDVELVVTIKGTSYTVKQRLYAKTIDDMDNGNVQHWDALYVEQLAIAPDGRAIAFVFANKPHVMKLPVAPATAPAKPATK